VARHRPRMVCVAAFISAIGALVLVSLFVFLVAQSLRVRASGLDVSLIDNANDSSVDLGDGRVVWQVVQPAGQMSDTEHARLLMDDPRFGNYTPLSATELAAGHLPWTAAADRPRVNFTLDHMEQLVRAQTDRNETTCVCYAAYGLPYNIVYLAGDDAVAYEPRVVQEFTDRVVRVKSECSLHSLLEETRRRSQADGEPEPLHIDAGREHFMTTNSSGIVEFLRRDGKRARQRMDLPEFPCVKHCAGFFGRDGK